MIKSMVLENIERFLLTLGFLKLMLVVAFFASFAFVEVPAVHAGSKGSCTGENLLMKLEEEDPLAYRQVIAQARAIDNSDSIFWKVTKDGIEDSYLFGTMHLADPKISTLAEDVKSAIADSNTVVIETLDVLDPQKAQQAMAGLAHLTLLTRARCATRWRTILNMT